MKRVPNSFREFSVGARVRLTREITGMENLIHTGMDGVITDIWACGPHMSNTRCLDHWDKKVGCPGKMAVKFANMVCGQCWGYLDKFALELLDATNQK